MLEQLQPKEVFHFFEEICAIPHGSGNVDKISDYLVAFAKERGLSVMQDSLKNVIITKQATAGYEEKAPVIIQGHMDMVAVKEEGCTKDMMTDGLDLRVDGDYVYAQGTSLGGDDGIAVAYALALLDSTDIAHPPLEVVITVDEEVGMDGATGIDLSGLKGSMLLNIDSETEGELTVACAGGVTVSAQWDVEWTQAEGTLYELSLSGLTGGHSGTEIDKHRANANKVLLHLLYVLEREIDLNLVSVRGGTKDNVIPRMASAQFYSRSDAAQVQSIVSVMEQALREEWQQTDPGLILQCRELQDDGEPKDSLEKNDFFRLLSFFEKAPDGVQAMSSDLPGLVETSLNMGTVCLTNGGGMKAGFLLRSSKEDAKKALCAKLHKLVSESQGAYSRSSDYPSWEFRKDSPLREKMVQIYRDQFGKEPVVLSIHAGLECGILAQKIRNLDAVSFGPDILDIHTTDEKLSISSTQRTWEYLKTILKELS